ncbi:LacI family DNA-binding transcriptional regulator [Thalassotalea litorea]|uniref:LacI family DNA-binding transcriptional regulator n=1 Tax=Thalassotalea litorea TaxID=2020715 RepID=UPI0037370FD1
MKTIKDVAVKAGVSPALVSRVLNNKPGVSALAREKIQTAINELNYYPNQNARALNKGNLSAIGVILPNIITPYFSSIVSGIENVTSHNEVQIVLNSSSFDQDKELGALNTLIQQRYQSVILFSTSISDQRIVEYADKVPGLVIFDRKIKEIEHRCIWLDDQIAAQLMVDELVKFQHQHIAVLDLPDSLLHSSRRFLYFKQILKARGITLSAGLIEQTDGTIQGGQDAIYNLLASGQKFTAVVCFNDATAYGAVNFLQKQGISIPKEVSVIGFNDSTYSKMTVPNFHTIHTPIKKMAERSTQLAIDLAKQPDLSIDRNDNIFTPHLVKNHSMAVGKALF